MTDAPKDGDPVQKAETAVGDFINSADWPQIANQAINMVAALVGFIQPGSAAALSVAVKILQGAIALEPAALALFNSIKNGIRPSPEQLKAFADKYETDYQTLHAAIQTQLAALPVTP